MNSKTIALPQGNETDRPVGYTYSYPHKTSYRAFEPELELADVWRDEQKQSLFLYLHVPFCEMRCGFCNLFTATNARAEMVEGYLDALERQAGAVARALGRAGYARMAIGGGTPTYLTVVQLERVFGVAKMMGADARGMGCSVETSPRTADGERLGVLKAHGVSRVSMGVQSFVEEEVAGSGRAQKNAWVDRAIKLIRGLSFPTLNLDLIYGLPGQTLETWRETLRHALEYGPEELYLYPLYVRPLTGLERAGEHAELSEQAVFYRAACEMLGEAGYVQHSMRMFRAGHAPETGGPVYCCQDDGMVGLGPGARSYTRSVHYSTRYAVGQPGVKEIIREYSAQSDMEMAQTRHGCRLDEDEQKRRWVIKGVLRAEGMKLEEYLVRFGSDLFADLPVLGLMVERGWLERTKERLGPTVKGLGLSDVMGPMLYSDRVMREMQGHAWS